MAATGVVEVELPSETWEVGITEVGKTAEFVDRWGIEGVELELDINLDGWPPLTVTAGGSITLEGRFVGRLLGGLSV